MIYPREVSQVFMPRDLDGSKQSVVLKAVHRKPGATLYWHLGTRYLGSTSTLHHMEVMMEADSYALTLVDEEGNRYGTELRVLE